MISVYWGCALAMASCYGITIMLLRLAEGLFQVDLERDPRYPTAGLATFISMFPAAAMLFFGVLPLFGAPIENLDRFYVSIQQAGEIGLGWPFLIVLAEIVAATAAVGAFRLFRSLSQNMRNLGSTLRTLGQSLRQGSWRTRRAAAAATAKSELSTALWPTAEQKFNSVYSLCNSLKSVLRSGQAFDHLNTIHDTLQKVRQVIWDDKKQSVLPMLISDYLTPTELYLQLYERLLKRDIDSAKDALTDMAEKTLPLMVEKIAALYGQIHVADIAQLATANSAFELARTLEVKLEAPAELAL